MLTMEEFIAMWNDAVDEAVKRGLKPPLTVCTVGSNGSVIVGRLGGPGGVVTLAEHTEGAGFRTPITLLIVDRDGASTRMVLEAGGKRTWH